MGDGWRPPACVLPRIGCSAQRTLVRVVPAALVLRASGHPGSVAHYKFTRRCLELVCNPPTTALRVLHRCRERCQRKDLLQNVAYFTLGGASETGATTVTVNVTTLSRLSLRRLEQTGACAQAGLLWYNRPVCQSTSR